MQRKFPLVLLAFMITVTPGFSVVRQYNGQWFDSKLIPSNSPLAHFNAGYDFLCNKKYELALANFLVVTTHYPNTAEYASAVFYSGVCHYFLAEFKKANEQFASYLLLDGESEFFEKVFEFKYHMADHYQNGMKGHLLGTKRLPRWVPKREAALDLYEEVIIALPAHDLAAKALYGKAKILLRQKEYESSADTLATLCRRFSNHPLAAEGYILISEVYLAQCKKDAQNPDLLGQAQVNCSYFEKSFPQDEKIAVVKNNMEKMEEILASSLYATGQFYERKSKPHASAIYYKQTVRKYPNTSAAQKCQKRLERIEGLS